MSVEERSIAALEIAEGAGVLAALDTKMLSGHVRIVGKDEVRRSSTPNRDGLTRFYDDPLAR